MTDDRHAARRGDCHSVLRGIPDGAVDAVVTDPPYNTANKNVKRLAGRKPLSSDVGAWDYFDDPAYQDFTRGWQAECARVLRPYGNLVSFCKLEHVSDFRRIYEGLGFRHHATIIWHKTNPSPQVRKTGFLSACEAILWAVKGFDEGKVPYTFNFKTQREMHNFVESPICMGKERTPHRTQKPLRIVTHLLEVFTNPGDLVLDPFAGSGTTAAAAARLGRRSLSVERDPESFRILRGRLAAEGVDLRVLRSERETRSYLGG